MKNRRMFKSALSTAILALIALLFAGGSVAPATAQTNDDPTQIRDRDQTQDQTREPKGEALRKQIRDRIENEDGLQTRERKQLKQHLEECETLGLGDEVVQVLFDDSRTLRSQIRNQERLLNMVREGLPIEPLMQKLQEGKRKGVTEEVMERVCDQMETCVRTANRTMERAREDGLTPGDPDAEQLRTREMAQHMWRGLNEENMDQLRERARLRLRDGSCTTEELATASETAAKLHGIGIEKQRAVRLAGNALQYGYSVKEMKQLGWMVMTAHMRGGPDHEVIETLEKGIRNQHQLGNMMQQMWQHGWMGPADGQGGHGPMDDKTGSGPGNQDPDKGHRGQGDKGGGNG